MRAAFSFAVPAVAFLAVSTAHAAPVSAPDLLNSYNLIVFGNLTNNSHVQGRAYVGGNAAGGEYNSFNQRPADGLPALTVGGNLTGNVNINGPKGISVGGNLAVQNYNQNSLGTSYVGGNVTGNANFKGDLYAGGNVANGVNVNNGVKHANVGVAAIASNLPDPATTSAMQATLANYSSWLDTMTATSAITLNGTRATFNATPNANGVAVFDINNASAFFNSINEMKFNVGSATEIIINVSGAGSGLLTLADNFLDGVAPSLGLNTIWNFTDAKSIKVENQFGGSVLALLADVTTSNNIEGTLVAKTATLNGQIHYVGSNDNIPSPPPEEAPPVSETPVPGALPLFATGLGALAFFARRRTRKKAA